MRTYTKYFSEDNPAIVKLVEATAELWDDLEKRRPFITEAAYDAAAQRISLLGPVRSLLVEPVPEPFGG